MTCIFVQYNDESAQDYIQRRDYYIKNNIFWQCPWYQRGIYKQQYKVYNGEEKTYPICFDNLSPVKCVWLTCGHVFCCSCISSQIQECCAICRQHSTQQVQQ